MVPPVRTLLTRGPKNSPTLTGGLLPLAGVWRFNPYLSARPSYLSGGRAIGSA